MTDILSSLTGEQLRYVLGPVVHQPGGWHDSLPKWTLDNVIPARIKQIEDNNATGQHSEASDLEVVIILFQATLCGPPTTEHANIYLKLTKKVMEQFSMTSGAFPIQEANDPFSVDEMHALVDLKRKIRSSVLRNCTLSQAKEKLYLLGEQAELNQAVPIPEQLCLSF